jgi:hypothetical protein
MPNHLLLEELHLTITVSQHTLDEDREVMRRTLNSRACQAALRKAVRDVFQKFPALTGVRIALTA